VERVIPLQRIALGIEYDGTGFAGWQAQRSSSIPTLQETLESALSQVADQPIRTRCAGRTDAGVHAIAQVVHFDTSAERNPRAWINGVNSLLPPAIAVRWALAVNPDFDARRSALYRRYRYLILTRAVRSPLMHRRACLSWRPLDVAAMRQAAQCLPGEHDFSAFRGAACQSRTAMRRIDLVEIEPVHDGVVIDVQANAFLLHMVRNIAGALMAVGSGDRGVAWIEELLNSRDRRLAAATAPAHGLYLIEVGYGREWGLPVLDSDATRARATIW
jgi:tRNA pseudouridine38-40 synthase